MRSATILTAFNTSQEQYLITTCIKNAAIQWTDKGFPFSSDYEDIYFSEADPVAESRYVFLHGNKLETLAAEAGQQPLVIGECGFGFGLNFLLAWEMFDQVASANARLHFISCELHPVLKVDLKRFHTSLPEALSPYSRRLQQSYPEQGAGPHRLSFHLNHKHIILDLHYNDANTTFNKLSVPKPVVDAWFLDGFAPSKNTDMWSEKLCQSIAHLSKPGASLSTYSVAGAVKRHLEKAGFKMEKIPGFGKKRHMLKGILDQKLTPELHPAWNTPWPEQPCFNKPEHSIAIIGGGLAGCSTAYALASRGFAVSLIEQESRLAQGASGNPRGIVHFKPSRRLTNASLFHYHAYLYALRHYCTLAQQHEIDWQNSGVYQLVLNRVEQADMDDLLDRKLYADTILKKSVYQISDQQLEIQPSLSALLLPETGSLDPVALCHAWAGHKNITLYTSHRFLGCREQDNKWLLELSHKGKIKTHGINTLVICNNTSAATHTVLPSYPFVFNHGQTDTYAVKTTQADNIFCHKGYAIPWHEGKNPMLTIGGSFAQGSHQEGTSATMREQNLALVKAVSDKLFNFLRDNPNNCSSRQQTRCTTPDYQPMIGPVEDRSACEEIYAGLKRNARKNIRQSPRYKPGLFINVGHGSHGLTTTPLAGEYLASLISGENLPLLQEQISAIHPLRFMIRELKKQK